MISEKNFVNKEWHNTKDMTEEEITLLSGPNHPLSAEEYSLLIKEILKHK